MNTTIMNTNFRMPAEWEAHHATWLAWPHNPDDFPEKLNAVQWVYTEIVLTLAQFESVEILCYNDSARDLADRMLRATGVSKNINFHIVPTDRSWVRDSFPIAVKSPCSPTNSPSRNTWIKWSFNAWAKYDNYSRDSQLPNFVASYRGRPLIEAVRQDGNPLVLEGGAIDVNGTGSLLTTEECLLSTTQQRNPGLSREDYELLFKQYLGVTNTIWLAGSCEGDDTHGHIDDAARFVSEDTVLVAVENDPNSSNFHVTQENRNILKRTKNEAGRALNVVELPMPGARSFDSEPLPASYANFYIANGVVIVPTFNDINDRRALSIIAEHFPDREVIGIHSVDLVLGYGTLHCLSQQEPA